MSVVYYGHIFIPIDERALPLEGAYERARELAQDEACSAGNELLTGPAQLIRFHELTHMGAHLVFPVAREVSER